MVAIDHALDLLSTDLHDVVTGRVVLVDGTDVIAGNRRQTGTTNYSYEWARQGVNIQVASDLNGRLLAVSDPFEGRIHDRHALANTRWERDLDQTAWLGDLGYQGTTAITPIRQPWHRKLTKAERDFNHGHSTIRNVVERTIAHLKNWRILTGYRNQLRRLPEAIRVVTKLELYRTYE